MKFTFEANLDYQRAAINAVTDLFRGQDSLTGQFTVQARKISDVPALPGLDEAESGEGTLGIGNRLRLHTDVILANLHMVQDRAGLAHDEQLTSLNFTIEMETGTGKTYVYLRTIHELHKLYGFTKFVVVVPSVAISEGVTTSIALLHEHFEALYPGQRLSSFRLDGGNLSRVRSFATSSGIEVLITTAAAVNKATNKVHQQVEDLGFEIPMDLIRATRPMVIVDEPQSVYGDDGNPRKAKGAGRVAIEGRAPSRDDNTVGRQSLAKGMHATAVLRYSATHPRHDKANLVYRLDAIAAYEQALVKQIEVDSLVTEANGTAPYVRLLQTKRTASALKARLELDVEVGSQIKRKAVDVPVGANLEDVTGRARYRHLTLDAISVVPGAESVRFGDLVELRVHDAVGAEITVDERARQMIAQTIRQHLRKEQEFAVAGRAIKVLSLLFVDSVAKYRVYDDNGDAQPGEYAQVFEEEYAKVSAEPEFRSLLGGDPADAVAARAHQGYFSIDRSKGRSERLVDTSETNDRGRQQASLAYEQIMKDKVGLTTPGSPIRFVFTHSALQEGWDNPNVFQICVLRTMGTERWRRQSIGRGLRICIDGSGKRVPGFDVNRLTVIANESYEEFAEQLQRELADDLGIEFGRVTIDGFARLTHKPTPGAQPVPVGDEIARALFNALVAARYVTPSGKGVAKVEDSLREAVAGDTEELRALVAAAVPGVTARYVVQRLIKRLVKPIDIRKAGDRVSVPVVGERLESPEFQALWERIKHRTQFRVSVEESGLQAAIVSALRALPPVPDRKGVWETTVVNDIDQGGLRSTTMRTERIDVAYADRDDLPDILSVLADRTQLTRRTLAQALTESGTLAQFRKNPQVYVDHATQVINSAKEQLLVAGLRYELVDATRPEAARQHPLSIFAEADLTGYTGPNGNVVTGDDGELISFDTKSPYKYIVVDSAVERAFAMALKQRTDVRTFVKLPAAFTIPTPLGDYNPDWAVVIERPNGNRYMVFETKGSIDPELLRPAEKGKVYAAECHFSAIEIALDFDDLHYAKVDSMDTADGVIDETYT
ncbi:DEAD/DEAH box helicase family protein [Actinokineospora auranticolor]|uniref:Type III restriction enzyme n=1 Tax=Actinokineospora auranticolor TaxID=155976 RepID=A0A2S6GRN4_9PSEU|nr:DEAD/DEAH box helicase family protein [Actinokineospora auranticolor]PPK67870.1 type III restriction enzyme [Actinokineospora auranticolor]